MSRSPMRIHHLNCGTLCPVGKLLMNGHGSPLARGTLVCHCQLVETGDGLVLIDTGLGTVDIREPMSTLPGPVWQAINQAQLRPEETAIARVRALGYQPADVRHIVLTHLDFDHAGGLGDFPHADVHVYALEHGAAMARMTPRERMRYAPRQFEHGVRWRLHDEDGERWFGFDRVRALPGVDPEILLVPLLGHSRGHCGVAVRTADGWLLNCGDAAFHHREIYGQRRRCPPGLRAYQNVFQFDRGARLFNQQRLRDLANDASSNVEIVCSHDPAMLRSGVVTADGAMLAVPGSSTT